MTAQWCQELECWILRCFMKIGKSNHFIAKLEILFICMLVQAVHLLN